MPCKTHKYTLSAVGRFNNDCFMLEAWWQFCTQILFFCSLLPYFCVYLFPLHVVLSDNFESCSCLHKYAKTS